MSSRLSRAARISALLALFGVEAHAAVPGHNPELDSRCKPGFQWSRKTVACEQAHCPPGAGRTYTLECNCGEAWNKPFVTCRERGLATHCIPKGQQCKDVPGGFDPLTDSCKSGFTKAADGTCQASFPETIRCQIRTVTNEPLPNRTINFYEKPSGGKFGGRQNATSDANGYVEFRLADPGASEIKFRADAEGDYARTLLDISKDRQPASCVVHVPSAADAEKHVEDGYAALLEEACVGADAIALMRKTTFNTEKNVDGPEYEPWEKRVNLAKLEGDWAEAKRALFHEFGHAVSDSVIDPSAYYYNGIPTYGKMTGGSHDNWSPAEGQDNWTIDLDAEELAFEEGIADFMALVYFRSIGEDYQDDLMTDARALQALEEHGADKANRIESVITRFLYEYYQEQIESGPAGAALALGDFIKTVQLSNRKDWFGKPARTIQEFLANMVRREKEGGDCSIDVRPHLGELAHKYKFAADDTTKLRLLPDSEGAPDLDRLRQRRGGMQFSDSPFQLALRTGEAYAFADGGVRLSRVAPDFVKTGRIDNVTFAPGSAAKFRLDGDTLHIDQGLAHVQSRPVVVGDLQVDPIGTEYVVDATGERPFVAVARGKVKLVGKKGDLELGEGEAAGAGADDVLAKLDSGKELLERFRSATETSVQTAAPRLAWWLWPAGGLLLLLGAGLVAAGRVRRT